MNLLTEFIKYRFKAKGRHGIHSPFVFNFVSNCLKANMENNFVNSTKKWFKKLRRDERILTIVDFGAGSKKLGNQRKVNQIFKLNTSKGKYARLLYKIVRYYQLQNSLEFGTSLGVGTIYLAQANNNGSVTTIEACTSIFECATANFSEWDVKNITAKNETFQDFLINFSGYPFDLIFIDGHHDGDALLEYMERLESCSHKDTFFILDDIRWSDSMFESWKKIVANEKYHLTMDLFRMGIVLKRPQQEKEHFVIRL